MAMILLVTATEMEALPLMGKKSGQLQELFVTGVGPLEAAVRLTWRLCEARGDITLVLNYGVAGAYAGAGAGVLDLCLAESEVMGDFGICYEENIEPFGGKLAGGGQVFSLEPRYVARAWEILRQQDYRCKKGVFVTVNSVSATAKRGAMLHAAHNGLCENMEGGAVARVCAEFAVPCLEVRCISNMVEDRNLANWQLAAAVQKCGNAVSLLLDHIVLI